MNQTPSIGRTVLYILSEDDAKQINERREQTGASGSLASPGETFPATVVRVWGPECVNLHVLLDGADSHWATSVMQADPDRAQQRSWHWPPRN